ncbi:MAG: hypothetical protein GX587_07550 [Bacteroidales bacterium]|nr:hypothetical protein [Bacteroidales bacterium]
MDRFAYPHLPDGSVLPPYSFPTYPDGSLRTTKADFALFLQEMMHGGTTLFSSNSVLETMIEAPLSKGTQGLAWHAQPLGSLGVKTRESTVGHTGGDDGIITVALWNTATDSALIIFMNCEVKMSPKVLNLLNVVGYLVEKSGT